MSLKTTVKHVIFEQAKIHRKRRVIVTVFGERENVTKRLGKSFGVPNLGSILGHLSLKTTVKQVLF